MFFQNIEKGAFFGRQKSEWPFTGHIYIVCTQLWLFNGEDGDSPVDLPWIFRFQFHFEVLYHGKQWKIHGKSTGNPLYHYKLYHYKSISAVSGLPEHASTSDVSRARPMDRARHARSAAGNGRGCRGLPRELVKTSKVGHFDEPCGKKSVKLSLKKYIIYNNYC